MEKVQKQQYDAVCTPAINYNTDMLTQDMLIFYLHDHY